MARTDKPNIFADGDLTVQYVNGYLEVLVHYYEEVPHWNGTEMVTRQQRQTEKAGNIYFYGTLGRVQLDDGRIFPTLDAGTKAIVKRHIKGGGKMGK